MRRPPRALALAPSAWPHAAGGCAALFFAPLGRRATTIDIAVFHLDANPSAPRQKAFHV